MQQKGLQQNDVTTSSVMTGLLEKQQATLGRILGMSSEYSMVSSVYDLRK
jgi:hypothetical protein